MAVQSAAVGAVSREIVSRSVRSASVTTVIAARSPVLRSSAAATSTGQQPPPRSASPNPYPNPHQPKDAHTGERTTCSPSGT
jgi:hypothetical protein